MYYYNHVFITPSCRKEIISSLCAFLIKKPKGKMMNQIEQIFPVTGRTHCTAVPLHAAWKKKANLQRGKERQLPKKSVESSRLYHQTCCRDEEEATGPPTATDGVLCLWYLASCLPGNACFCCRFWKCLERWGACSYWWDRKKTHPSHRWVVDTQCFHTGLPPPSDLLTGWNFGEQLTKTFILPSMLGAAGLQSLL